MEAMRHGGLREESGFLYTLPEGVSFEGKTRPTILPRLRQSTPLGSKVGVPKAEVQRAVGEILEAESLDVREVQVKDEVQVRCRAGVREPHLREM